MTIRSLTLLEAFPGLESYSAEQTLFWNWLCRVFSFWQHPSNWFEPLLQEILQRPAGHEIQLTVLSGEEDQKEYTFFQSEVLMGRSSENPIPLESDMVSSEHARIYFRDQQYFVEDAGSRQGTFLNGNRLTGATPLKDEDEITVFPYRLRIRLRPRWSPIGPVQFQVLGPRRTSVGEFLWASHGGFPIRVDQASGTAFLGLEEGFVEELLKMLLGPLGWTQHREVISQIEQGILECLFLTLAARVSQKAYFPHTLELDHFAPSCPLEDSLEGLGFSIGVAVPGLKGSLKLFLPFSTLRAKAPLQPLPDSPINEVSWQFPVVLGSASLRVEEIENLETGDIVLLDQQPALVVPGHEGRRWRCAILEENPWKLRIESNYEEKEILMGEQDLEGLEDAQEIRNDDTERESPEESLEAEGEAPTADAELETAATEKKKGGEPTAPPPDVKVGGTPNLEDLPVIIHAIIGKKEMTFQEASSLAKGAIIELETHRSDVIEIAANGKVLGQAELVEVEGNLGVRIISWS